LPDCLDWTGVMPLRFTRSTSAPMAFVDIHQTSGCIGSAQSASYEITT
jgi:hypothetical protein